MRKVILIMALAVFTATLVSAAALIQRRRLDSRALPAAEETVKLDERFNYDVFPGPGMRTYDLRCDVTLKRPQSSARLVFDFSDAANHHYVELSPAKAEIVVMQDGIGRVLETVRDLSLPVGEPLHVVIRRRELAIRVAVNDVVLADAFDEKFHCGKAGYASAGDGADFAGLQVQSVAEIYFADDFMRSKAEKGPWTELRGGWSINALEHASMSANAFQYTVEGQDEGVAVAGYPFWNDYSFEASVNPQKSAAVGLYFYYRDENNYFRFDWHGDEGGQVGSGRKELVRMWHGEKTVLASEPGGFRPNQWYNLKCQVSGRHVRTFIDENAVFDLHDARLTGGMVGLFAAANSRTCFDDVFVRSYRYFEDRFTNGSRAAWSFIGGKWSRTPLSVTGRESVAGQETAQTAVMRVSSPNGQARAVVGSSSWQNYILETEIHPDRTGRTGVVLYYQDETRYYQVSCRKDAEARETWVLELVLDGAASLLDQTVLDSRVGSRKVTAGLRDGFIRVTVDGRQILQAFDTSLRSGQAGLFAADSGLAAFGPVKVDWPLEEPPLLTLNEIFEHEKSMSPWSSIESDWQRLDSGVWLNKGNFPGDATIETDVISMDGADSELRLFLSSEMDSGGDGYELKLAASAKEGKKKMKLDLLRKGEKIESKALEPGGQVSRLSFKRVGEFLVGSVNRQPVLVRRDRSPLGGDQLGWYGRNVKVDASTVSVSSPNVRKYLFRKAYTDWRVVKGLWEVTNRWTCDRRWSFFSGRSSLKLAAIWNKRSFTGDVTVDFYAGVKMDNERGDRYEYASDINCTIAGDGTDLNSGYSFLFGGFGNTKTLLMKGNRVLAEGRWSRSGPEAYMQKGQRVLIPTAVTNIHRTWFHVKAQKQDKHLRLWIDDQLVIDCVDDAPLTGDRVALWTWSNGVMLARVTVAADGIGGYEHSDVYQPSYCRCVYDERTVAAGQ